MSFNTTFGLFSPKAIDHGSEQLLKQIKLPDNARVLDIGSGYGPIGLTLAKESEFVHLIDKDFVAIDYCGKNAVLNGLENVKVYLSNGLSHVPDEARFNVIVSNIPAKVGKEMLQQILDDAKLALIPGGMIYIVVIAGLKEFMKRELKARFGNYKKLKSTKGYYCLSTTYEQ
jgi:16S rRNA (guanine1207-N2)-methyltransferase